MTNNVFEAVSVPQNYYKWGWNDARKLLQNVSYERVEPLKGAYEQKGSSLIMEKAACDVVSWHGQN